MRTFFKILGIILALLIAVLLWNTFNFKSKQLTDIPPAPAISVSDSAIVHLSQAVRFKTISNQDPTLNDSTAFTAFISYLERAFPLAHERLQRERINDFALLFEWKGSDALLKPILMMGHYDVVPVIEGTEDLWEEEPFSGLVQDGFVYGRGTLDDKSTVMGLLEAAEYLLSQNFQPKRTIYFSFGHDEEVSGRRGGQALARTLEQRGVQLEMVIDEGGTIKTDGVAGLDKTVALIGIAEKGYTSIQLTAKGQGGHSSMPPDKTSIGLLATALDRLQNTPFKSSLGGTVGEMLNYLGPEMPFGQKLAVANKWLLEPVLIKSFGSTNSGAASTHTTIAPTILRAGVKDNVLPIDATAIVNFRILPGDSVQGVLDHVRSAIYLPEIEVISLADSDAEPSPVSSPNAAPFQLLSQTIISCYPGTLVTPYLVLGATDARYYRKLSDNVYRFTPYRLNEQDLDRIHGTNERIEVEAYKAMIRFYATLLQNFSMK